MLEQQLITLRREKYFSLHTILIAPPFIEFRLELEFHLSFD